MDELFAGWRFVFPRVHSTWRLLTITALGVLIAAVLLAAVPLYSNALSSLGLQFRLERALEDRLLNTVTVEQLLPGDPVDVARRRAIDTAFDARVGWLGPERLVEERSGRLLLDFAEPAAVGSSGETVTHQPWNAFLFWLSGFERNMTVTEGRLPGAPDQGPEVVLLDGFQQHAALGDIITLDIPGFDDCESIPGSQDPDVARFEVRCRPTAEMSQTVAVTVVGFVRPDDPTDQRWELFDASFAVPDQPLLPHVDEAEAEPDAFGAVNSDAVRALAGEGSMPLLTSEEQLFGTFGVVTPRIPLRHSVALVADIRALSLGDVERGIDAPRQLRSDLNERLDLLAVVRFSVGETLSRFRNTQTFEQVPLLIILLQVVGIVVYYVAVVASMLVERQAEEISVYRSRGASTAQLVGLYLMEGAFMAAIAAAVAPWVAGQAVAALGYTPTFTLMTDGGALPVAITPDAYLLAAGGAALALLALLLPAFAMARSGIVDLKREQSRPPGRSLIQRYYLDLGAVVLAAILLWQLGQRGTIFDPDAVGGWSSDPLLLLSPFVFTLAVAALVLRFYPPLLRWAVALLLAMGGTSVALGLRRAARAPAGYARLLLLLLMAISVGTFAASYGPTVDRSQSDRIRYATGADIRFPLSTLSYRGAEEGVAEVRALDRVDDAALAHRDSVSAISGGSIQTLAVDARRASSMLWFRDDFADVSLGRLMRELQSDVPSGECVPLRNISPGHVGCVQLTPDTEAIRLSVFTTQAREQSLLWARFRDANGSYVNARIAPVDFEAWQEVFAPLPDRGARPLSFVGLRVSGPQGSVVSREGALYIDDVTAVLASGEEVLLDDFERGPGRFGWRMFTGRAINEQVELSDEQSVSGDSAAKWTWPLRSSPAMRLLAIDGPNVPLAAIINPIAAARLGIDPAIATASARAGAPLVVTVLLGDIVVPLSVRAVVDMFPTLDPERSFIVLNFDHVRELAGLVDVNHFRLPNELWIHTDAPLERQVELVQFLWTSQSPLAISRQVEHQDAQLEMAQADPTLRASGTGILTAAFSAVLGLSMLGFVVTLALGARNRVLEFAVLRAVGSSRSQILRSMVLEWGVVLAIGSTIGVLLGQRVATVMLSFLDVTEEGKKVVPPFTLETDWRTLGLGVGLLATVAALGLLFSWAAAVRREATVTELRLTR